MTDALSAHIHWWLHSAGLIGTCGGTRNSVVQLHLAQLHLVFQKPSRFGTNEWFARQICAKHGDFWSKVQTVGHGSNS